MARLVFGVDRLPERDRWSRSPEACSPSYARNAAKWGRFLASARKDHTDVVALVAAGKAQRGY